MSHSTLPQNACASGRYWQQFQQALQRCHDQGDVDALRTLNRKLVAALMARGAPKTSAELQARQALAQCHQAIIASLEHSKAELGRTMAAFRANQDGLAAYELTSQSSYPDQNAYSGQSTSVNQDGGLNPRHKASQQAALADSHPQQQGYPSTYGD